MGQKGLDLIQRLQAHDPRAMGLLYDQLAPLVHAVILRILGDPAEAEDVLLETFWQVWHGAANYDPLWGTVDGWVLTLARRQALGCVRARPRRPRAPTASSMTPPACPPPPDIAPESSALHDERARVMHAALATLPAEQRQALEYAYYHGWGPGEMAQHLAQPLETMKTRLRVGLLRLRVALQPYVGGRS